MPAPVPDEARIVKTLICDVAETEGADPQPHNSNIAQQTRSIAIRGTRRVESSPTNRKANNVPASAKERTEADAGLGFSAVDRSFSVEVPLPSSTEGEKLHTYPSGTPAAQDN